MANHRNRGWRSRWSIDLEAATAKHRDGWVFKFSPAADQARQARGDDDAVAYYDSLDV